MSYSLGPFLGAKLAQEPEKNRIWMFWDLRDDLNADRSASSNIRSPSSERSAASDGGKELRYSFDAIEKSKNKFIKLRRFLGYCITHTTRE